VLAGFCDLVSASLLPHLVSLYLRATSLRRRSSL
jgi:hypothetical protein